MTAADRPRSRDPIDVRVGERIRLQRMTLGMSQGALAAKLGVTFQQIQKYEKGSNRVGAGRLQAVAQALGVPIDFFFGDGEPSRGGPAGLLSADGIRLSQAFIKIDDATLRRRVIDLVRTLADAEERA